MNETILLILKLLDLLASVALRAPAIRAQFTLLREELETMVLEDRGPTPEQWESINQRADDIHAQLQGQPDEPA